MLVSYEQALTALAAIVAICGCYVFFHVAEFLPRMHGVKWKLVLAASALSLGGGAWAAHFISLLAFSVPNSQGFDTLPTFLSLLITVVFSGLALYVLNQSANSGYSIFAGGALIGIGIAGMHYVVTAEIRGGDAVSYSSLKVALSLLVITGLCVGALFIRFILDRKWNRIAAAVVLGIGIFFVPYLDLATSIFSPGNLAAISAPALGHSAMIFTITLVACFLFGSAFILGAPAPRALNGQAPRDDELEAREEIPRRLSGSYDSEIHADGSPRKIPVRENKRTVLLESKDVVCIQADSHYTKVCTREKGYFCNLSISDMEKRLPLPFTRVHRSHIVNLSHVKAFQRRHDQGEVIVVAAGSEKFVPVSRNKMDD